MKKSTTVSAQQEAKLQENKAAVQTRIAQFEAELRARPRAVETSERLVESSVSESGVALVAALDKAWLPGAAHRLLPYAPGSGVDALQLLNRDVALLLAAPHHVFWSAVLLDAAVARFLDSYLCFVRRPYEAQALRSSAVGERFYDAASLETTLLVRVFRLLVRLATRKEAEHLFLAPEYYGAALLDAKLVSVPMLFDIAAVYGQCATDTVAQMITGWFAKLPALAPQLAEHWPLVGDALRAATKRAAAAPFVWSAAVETVSFVHDIMHAVRAFCLAYEAALGSLSDDLLVLVADAAESASELAEQIVARVDSAADDDDADDDDDAAADELRHATAQRQSVLAQRCVQHATATVALAMRASYWSVAIGSNEFNDEILGAATKRDASRQSTALRGACALIVRLSRVGRRALLLREAATIDDFAGRLVDLHMAQPSVLETSVLEGALAALGDGGGSLSERVRARSRLALQMAASGGDESKWRELEAACDAVRQVVPDVGDGFVLRCLEAMGGSAEAVVNALLSDELPPSVAQLARSTTLAQLANVSVARRELTRGANEMRERMAVYGDDEFDVLGGRAMAAIDEGRIFRGKRELAVESKRERLESSFTDKFIEQLYDDERDDSFDSFAPGVEDGEKLDEDTAEQQKVDDDAEPSAGSQEPLRGRGAAARGRGGGRGGARTAAAHKYKAHHRKDRALQKRAI